MPNWMGVAKAKRTRVPREADPHVGAEKRCRRDEEAGRRDMAMTEMKKVGMAKRRVIPNRSPIARDSRA